MQSSGPPASTPASTVSSSTCQTPGNLSTKPGGNIIRPSQPTSYHVPRGAAAVANIAMPRPASVATVRSGPAGSLVSIRGPTRAPSPAPPQQQQQTSRSRPVTSPAHTGPRPIIPQRADTPRPQMNPSMDKSFGKSAGTLAQGTGRIAPLAGPNRLAAPPPTLSQGQQVQIVTQAVTQAVPLATSLPASQTTIQPTMQVITQTAQIATAALPQSGIQPTLSTVSSATGSRPRPMSQGTQAGAVSTLSTNPPAVVLAAPARLASPGLIGVQTGPGRLAVATALPATGARIVSPTARGVPQGRTVTYTSAHQMLQTARLPPAPLRLGSAGRGVVSLQPVLGVAPLKPAPTLGQGSVTTNPISTQSVGQTSNLVSTQTSAVSTTLPAHTSSLPSLQPAPLRSVPAQSKVVTVAAVGAGPLRSVVAAVPPGVTSTPSLAPVPSITSAPISGAPATKTGTTYPQTLTTVAARPVAVAGQPVRPTQPSVYIQATHRSSPGPAGERSGTFPLQSTAYFYEAPPGAYQVANVSGRSYAGGPPYIVQATAARPVGTSPQVHVTVASSVPGSTPGPIASGTSNLPGVTSVVSSAPPGSGAVSTITGNVVSSVATGQPPRFNSIMVLDPSRTALPIHAVVPAEGGATGTTYIAADGSLLPVQALPVSAAAAVQASQSGSALASQSTPASSQAASKTSQEVPQPVQTSTQIVTQVGTVVSQAVTSSSLAHLPMQIQMVPAPVHIQMHPQSQTQLTNPISQPQIHHSTSQTVTTSHLPIHTSHPSSHSSYQSSQTQTPSTLPISLAVSHQVLSHAVPMSLASSHVQSHGGIHVQANTQGHLSHSSHHPASQAHTPHSSQTQTPTTPNKPNASPRPSILRKRDNEGSPLKAQKNLTPLLQSMSSSNPTPSVTSSHPNPPAPPAPPSPPSPPKRPDSGGPQSSGSTTISATSSPGQESPTPGNLPPPSAASITAGLHAAGLHGTEMSPRKKPRKQQLTGNELQEHKMSDEDMEFLAGDHGDDFPLNPQPQQQQQLHQQVLQQQQQQQQQALPPPPPAPREFTVKRPNISLLSTYRYSWKSRNNHFLRHSDVRPKDERRPSVSDLASQRHIYQRLNGWKVHHLTTQMEDLADVESQVCQQLEAMLGVMERKAEQDEDKDVNRVNELIKGNMQRSRVIADQLVEAKATVMKIFEHKPHVTDIIHRSSGKRTFKKREKS